MKATGRDIDEVLTQRVRASLKGLRRVEEKRMFGSIAFIVNGKMCVSVGHGRMMCRIDPEVHEAALERKGARTVNMKGREYKGFVYVDRECLTSKRQLDYWIKLSLKFNKRAKASRKRRAMSTER